MNTRLILISFLVAHVVGCAHFASDPAARLETRATAHWQAKQDKQWGKAYDFYCGELKSEADKIGYIASSNLEITAFQIDNRVISDDGKTATVGVVCDFLIQGHKFPGAKFKEEWSYVDNDWCLSKKSGFNTLFEKK